MKENMKSRILALLVALAMVLSVAITIVNPVGATIGVDDWQDDGSGNDILNQTTDSIKYDQTVSVKFNGTLITANSYIYKPNYERVWDSGSGTYEYYVNWTQVSGSLSASDSEPTKSLTFDRAGLWLVVADNAPYLDTFNMSNMSIYDVSDGAWENIVGWFWVNSSAWTVHLSDSTAKYDRNDSLSITVKEDGSPVSSSGWIDMWLLDGNSRTLIYHHELEVADEGRWNISNLYTYTHDDGAGIYQFTAYEDIDPSHSDSAQIYGEDGDSGANTGYNETFGNFSLAQWLKFRTTIRNCDGDPIDSHWANATYKYATCGPFDPPEYWADGVNLTVEAGEPTLSIPTANQTMYWNFSGEVNITIKDYDGNNLTTPYNVYIYNDDDENVTANFSAGSNGRINKNTGYCLINSSGWGKNGTDVYGENGTWSAIITKTNVGNASEEWNGTAEWSVSTAPGLQIKITDPTDKEIASIPAIGSQPMNIKFQIINAEHNYYGKDNSGGEAQAKKNITISGDALFLDGGKTLDDLPASWSYCDAAGTWTVNLTPTMAVGGGTITVAADWQGNGTASEDIDVGGTDYLTNGTVVSLEPTEFVIDKNVTLTVTVTDAAGDPYKNANIWLCYVKDDGSLTAKADAINSTTGGGNSNGEYTFFFNTTQQTTNQTTGTGWGTIQAPRNISAYVELASVGNGYAVATMKPQSDLKVHVSKDAIMAGEKSEFYVNISVVDSTGNTTGYPNSGDNLQVYFYNSTGDKVTLDSSFGSIRDGDLDEINNSIDEYILEPGVYTLYAKNNTHDSTGFNATFEVKSVEVTCDKEEFIWNVDKNISAIFNVTYNGLPVDGKLKLFNITKDDDYNKTWVNYTTNDEIELTIENGEATLNNITANFLPASIARKNVTFEFKSDHAGSQYAKASGLVPVKIPDVAASPTAVPYNQASELEITVTGRDTGLEDVWVSINVPGLSGEMNTTTDANGKATFAFTPPTTGDITIAIENRTSDTTVAVTSWKLYIDAPSQIEEDDTLTVTVRNRTAAGAVLADATVTFNKETKTTDSNGEVTFTAPTVTANRDYTIIATKAGYADDSETITVLNVPELYIDAPTKVSAGATLTVTVYSDTGTVNGATVTLDGQTKTTLNGKAQFTAPETAADYTISVSKTGYEPASQTITVETGGAFPGFEALTLIAAIGIALILLSRRKRQ